METTLYDEAPFSSFKDSMNVLKGNMTLDLGSPKVSKKQRYSCLLSSPDLNMLKLGSPELEKLIIAQNGLVTTSPTPTQYLFVKSATEEQENYAQGFSDALAQLQSVNCAGITYSNLTNVTGNNISGGILNSIPTTTCNNTIVSTSLLLPPHQPSISAPTNITHPLHQDLHHENIATSSAAYPISSLTSSSSASSSPFIPVSIKDEPQTVPSIGSSPPMSPIDMEDQEKIKLERKRQRNRMAATKCRKRKLERIAKLEDKVNMMKSENNELSSIVTKLRDQVCVLKEEVMRHTRNGCQIMTTDIMASHI